jgi:hypothetical protein
VETQVLHEYMVENFLIEQKVSALVISELHFEVCISVCTYVGYISGQLEIITDNDNYD